MTLTILEFSKNVHSGRDVVKIRFLVPKSWAFVYVFLSFSSAGSKWIPA